MAGSPATENYNEAGNCDFSRKTVALAGWPSPVKGNGDGGHQMGRASATGRTPDGGKVSVTLNGVAKFASWATPRVTNNGGTGNPDRAHDGKSRLEDQVFLASWNTPRDGRDEGRTASSERGSIGGCGAGELENPASERRKGRAVSWNDIKKSGSGLLLGGSSGDALRPGPVNGFWRDADWIFCTDNRWRPIGASLQPLVNGSAFRLGSGSPYEGKSRAKMLRGYGNAINAEAARAFIEAFLSRKETE
jgi:hypothetical protein